MRQGPQLPQGVAQPLKQNNCAAVTKTPTNQYLWCQLPQAALHQCLRVSRCILILQQSLHMLRWVEYAPQSTLRALQPLIRLRWLRRWRQQIPEQMRLMHLAAR
jgi:hypothetical protein